MILSVDEEQKQVQKGSIMNKIGVIEKFDGTEKLFDYKALLRRTIGKSDVASLNMLSDFARKNNAKRLVIRNMDSTLDGWLIEALN